MAKLIVVVALTFTVLVAFASAYRPTLIEDLGSSVYSKQQCSQQLQGQRFNRQQHQQPKWRQARKVNKFRDRSWARTWNNVATNLHNTMCCIWTPPPTCWPCMISREDQQGQGLEQCCNELEEVEEECQCEAMKEVYRQAQQQQWSQQGGRQQQQQTQDLPQIVQNLRNQCNLQVQQCRIPYATMF